MADNFYYDPGTTEAKETGGADDIGGVKYPRVKIIVGADGTNDGDVATGNPMPVSDAGGSLTVDGTVAVTDLATLATAAKQDTAKGVLDTIDADTGAMVTDLAAIEVLATGIDEDTNAIKTAVELLDNSVDGNYLNVNANLAGTDVTAGAGAVAAGTPRVTLASDDPAVTDLAALEVLATGIDQDTDAIKTAVQLLDNAVDGNYLNVNSNIAGTDMVGGAGAVAAGVQRVTLASDDPAVTDLAALEVLATSIDEDTNAIKTAVEVLDNAIAGTEMQVDVVASLPAGTNAIGKLAANSGVDIGDVDVTSTSIDKSINGAGAPTIDSYTHASINLAAGANQVLVASAANKQIWVYGLGFTVNVAGTVSFQDEDDTAITGIMPIAATGGMTVSPSGNFAMPIWKLGTDKDLEVDVVTSELDGWLDYAIVSV